MRFSWNYLDTQRADCKKLELCPPTIFKTLESPLRLVRSISSVDKMEQLQGVANKLLIKQMGIEDDTSEIMTTDAANGQQKQQPIRLDELPAPLRKIYTNSAQDSGHSYKHRSSRKKVIFNEPLVGGFALLRAAQLLNIDVYYVGLESKWCRLSKGKDCWNAGDDMEAIAGRNVSIVRSCSSSDRLQLGAVESIQNGNYCYRTILDDLASYNPLQKYIDRHDVLKVACNLAKIFLSLTAIIVGFYEFISTVVLCLMTIGTKLETSDSNSSSMGLFVLVLVQFSSIYILFSTIFNGHLLWNLFSQRQFLISKRFQYKTMLKLLVFIYLEYIVNTAFVCNLYDWDFTSNNIESGSYSVLANLRILVTFKDFDHFYVDVLMTILSFARGIIRMSPYITINYAIICLNKHIITIRNQRLLTDSLKKKQKLRSVVGKTNRRRNQSQVIGSLLNGNRAKKKVNFVTEPIDYPNETLANGETHSGLTGAPIAKRRQTLGAIRSRPSSQQTMGLDVLEKISDHHVIEQKLAQTSANQENLFEFDNTTIELQRQQSTDNRPRREEKRFSKDFFLERIEDFDELESYITNMYIFTGKLNRFMSSQGLTVFFIVHNLVVSVSLIRPEAITGGVVMVQFIRLLLILIAITPFIVGQSLRSQLEQLSKQIDRIIIQQHFIHRRRDNLVRIRGLIHDIKVNCGGMLNFNVATGVKYLVVAFASAFFIEQERKYRIYMIRFPTSDLNLANPSSISILVNSYPKITS